MSEEEAKIIDQEERLEKAILAGLDAIFADDVDKFIEINSNVQIQDIHFAISYKVPEFLSYGPPMICVAAYFHAEKIVDYLINVGVNLDFKDSRGMNVIHYAAAGGSLSICKMLDNECNMFKREDSEGNVPMHIAAMYNSVDIVKYSYAHGIILDAVNNNGVTPLMLAAKCGSIDILKLLNDNGINMHDSDSSGNNALHYAAMGNSTESLIYLAEECGVLITRTNHNSETPLIIACARGCLSAVKCLVEKLGDKVKVRNKRKVPIVSACQSGNLSLVKYLISKGASLNDFTSQGETPKDATSDYCHYELLKWIKANK
ncbi:ankyrin repeat protein, putative [Trichomonas vaginalis G3]|uniref:Ankyrin repeat protein, putative n=1 Tax=Trichomonas vaginalis (strain ATCC PRA-98 / G3) TaxID=412133 RepID=A2F8D8_TRIV3|nr:spectrin binding [Trichomonas vaginalis G3]EAX98840.1 ankyrin repeat protein, putative [Trichomonas vaginalis G3]KAI5532238.1 spectrin binding [Trichomonas vaginalis G3]|eukprot:XP_001311770.1 ankyrin repeat protein [Trichomonas vaginalis G3]